jgi:hypothetical protein
MSARKSILAALCLAFVVCPALACADPDSTATSRNVFRDLAGGVVDLGEDAWDWVSAPFHWNQRQALQFGGILAAGAVIFIYDQEIHDWVARNQEDTPWKQFHEVGKFFEPAAQMNNSNPYIAGGIAVTYILNLEPFMRVLQQMLYANLISGASMLVVRPLVGRQRPRDGTGPYVFSFGEDGTAFPSGHTSSAFILARVLAHHIDWWPASVVLYGAAGSVAYQRVAVTYGDNGEVTKEAAHWPSDVWFGMWWGLSVANVVIRNSEARHGPQFHTGIDGRTGAMTVTMRWSF